jgi:hypothetical protein
MRRLRTSSTFRSVLKWNVICSINNLIQKTVAAFGELDIFVNNAGIEKKFAFVDYPLEELTSPVFVPVLVREFTSKREPQSKPSKSSEQVGLSGETH